MNKQVIVLSEADIQSIINGRRVTNPIYMSYPINDGLDKWIDDNEETFAHAWLDGYEVEKEQLYYVDFIKNDDVYKRL